MNFFLFPIRTSKVSKALLLSAAVALFNCKGKEGEPGPKGANAEELRANGFIKGTMTGTRSDGTPFTSNFTYSVANVKEGFQQLNDTLHTITIQRNKEISNSTNSSSLRMILALQNKGKSNQKISFAYTTPYTNDEFYLRFDSVLADRKLFQLMAGAEFYTPTEIFNPISKKNNAVYKLYNYGKYPDYYVDGNGNTYYYCRTQDGSKVYFREVYDPYRQSYTFAYVEDSKGTKSTTSSLYKDLMLMRDYSYSNWYYQKGTINLSATEVIPADKQEITNFKYDATTGLLTFDYKVNIEADRLSNSTKNPLEITGSVSTTVYDGIVMRKGNL